MTVGCCCQGAGVQGDGVEEAAAVAVLEQPRPHEPNQLQGLQNYLQEWRR